MANIRIKRINEEYKKELSNIISNEIRDPRLTAMVSVTDVVVTNDLKYAKVYLSIFGKNKKEKEDSLKALKSAVGFMRNRLSKTVNLRNTPELMLIEDNTIDYGMHMDALIKSVSEENSKSLETSKDDSNESLKNNDEKDSSNL